MVRGDVIHTVEYSFLAGIPLLDRDRAAINALLRELEERLMGRFTAEGWLPAEVRFVRSLYMKYRLQVHELAVALTTREVTEEEALCLPDRFEQLYEDIYGKGTGYRQVGIEIVKVRVDGVAVPKRPPLAKTAESPESDPSPAFKGNRDAYIPSLHRFASIHTYDGDRLRHGNTLQGPCIVERVGDTIVIPSECRGSVDAFGTICLNLGDTNG
jgi:N-methylhydantoinase A